MAQMEEAVAGAQEGLPPPYRVYDIDVTLFDASGRVVETWRDVQELVLEPPTIAVRRTRELADGETAVYEDRGELDEQFNIVGRDGFGGAWSGRPFPQDGIVYTQGEGGPASFTMTNWTERPGEEHCLRVLDVREPVAFLSADPLRPGRYYVRTHDHMRSASGDVPDSMRTPPAG